MKAMLEVCLVLCALAALAQDPSKPVLREGIHVDLPKASHASEMKAADAEDATVVTVNAAGKMFLATKPVDAGALADVKASVVYVKADARAPFQNVVAAFDALHGHSIVLLTRPQAAEKGKLANPYGLDSDRTSPPMNSHSCGCHSAAVFVFQRMLLPALQCRAPICCPGGLSNEKTTYHLRPACRQRSRVCSDHVNRYASLHQSAEAYRCTLQ